MVGSVRAAVSRHVPAAIRQLRAIGGGLGIALLILGTFLPWLRSGRRTRNSYETTGTVRRLIAPEGLINDLFRVWPLLGVACAVVVATYLLGLRMIAAALGVIVAVAGGAASLAALNAPANAYASVIGTGPAITLGGAGIVLISAAGQIAATAWTRAHGRTQHEPTTR